MFSAIGCWIVDGYENGYLCRIMAFKQSYIQNLSRKFVNLVCRTWQITKVRKKNKTKTKTDEQINSIIGLEPWDQSSRQKQMEDDSSVIQVMHVQMKVAERGMNNFDEELWVK